MVKVTVTHELPLRRNFVLFGAVISLCLMRISLGSGNNCDFGNGTCYWTLDGFKLANESMLLTTDNRTRPGEYTMNYFHILYLCIIFISTW